MSLLRSLDGEVGVDSADAVVVDGEATSWETLARRADALGAEIAGAPMVAVCATSTLDTVVSIVAGLRAGVPVVPVPSDAGPLEREHVLRDSGATLLLGDPDWAEVDLPRIAVPGAEAAVSGAAPLVERAGTDTALVMYTSGTTGPPKGAMLSYDAIAADLDGLASAWGWTSDDTLAHGLPLFHVHGLVLGVLGALRAGSHLVHTGRPSPTSYAAAVEKGATMLFAVPTIWSRLVADPALCTPFPKARLLVSGSAALPVAVFEAMGELCGQRPVERYGMTESLITVSTRFDGERRAGYVGLPITGVETRLRPDEGDADVPHDGETIGGLQVRGTTLFNGYLNQPEKTAAIYTEDGWMITGDAVTISPDGFHRVVGRASIDIIKSGGYKVGAGEVEAAVLSHPAIHEVAVVGVADADLGERIVAYVVADPVDPAAVIEHVASLLSVHKRPREIRVVDALPRNAMGKVQKAKLK